MLAARITLPHFAVSSARRREHAAAKSHDELAPLHSITSSARASRVGGTVMPTNLAA